MAARMPTWMIVVIVIEFFLTGIFFLFGYSLSSSLAQGRPMATEDIVAVALPLFTVAVCSGAAWALWRAGQRSLAAALVWAPIPLFLVFFAYLAI